MPDLDQLWGNDIAIGPTGDLATVDNLDLSTERILRRLMTNARDYIFHLDYGAGVPKRVGDVLDVSLIRSVIRRQIFLEESVAPSPPPIITVQPILNGVNVTIQYTFKPTGEQSTLNFDVSA